MASINLVAPKLVRQSAQYMCWAAVLSSWTHSVPAGSWSDMSQQEIRERVQQGGSGGLSAALRAQGALNIGMLQEFLQARGLEYFGMKVVLLNSLDPAWFYITLRDETRWPIFLGYKDPASSIGFHANFVYGAESDGREVQVMEPYTGEWKPKPLSAFSAPYVIGYHFRTG